MNKVEYNQTEGFPLDVNILDFGQKANQISQELGHIIAPLAIVTGCIENGNNISDGVVFIEGELLPFKGGLKQDNIRIVENIEKREFENGVQKNVLFSREATFGIGAVKTYKWSDFHRSITIKEIEKRLVHPGFIQDYYGDVNKVPAGWYLCDGQNGTPDLRGMFVVGYDNRTEDYNAVGNMGGDKEVTLTINQMPSHRHDGNTSTSGDHVHTMFADSVNRTSDISSPQHVANKGRTESNSRFQFVIQQNNQGLQPTVGRTSNSGSHFHTMNLNNTGGDQAHENRPPFYVLAKIIYKG